MSAFVMETTGFNTLANYLLEYASSNAMMNSGRKHAVLRFLSDNDDWQEYYDADTGTLIGLIEAKIRDLITANYAAVEQRYDEELTSDYFEFKRKLVRVAWTPIQVIKNLQCLRYQASEGDVPQSKIYKKLERLIADLSEAYVHNTSEYENASWGW